ncbi:MAG TPA: PDZ domain-containing protein [Candidatus Aquilonibacter sp.]
MKLLARLVLVAITAFVVVVFYAPAGHADYTGVWQGGTYGVRGSRAGPAAAVQSVAPGSPAARAGIRPGDRLIIAPFSKAYPDAAFPRAGDRHTFELQRPDGTRYRVTMTAVPVASFTRTAQLLGVLALLPATIFLAIAFVLVFLRPSVMTWSFYAYAAGYLSTGPSFGFFHPYLSTTGYVALTFVLTTFFGNFAVLPLLPFILRFPDNKLTGFRRSFDRAIWVVIVLAFVAYSYQWYLTWSSLGTWALADILDEWLPLATFATATLILVRKYKHATPPVRQRFGFLMIGVGVSFVAYALYFIPGIPPAVAQVAGGAVVIMPICVMYAVLKHRVLDVNFVLNRALGYSILSVIVIAFVSLLDWGAGHVISEGRFATSLELILTIAVGFLLDRINKGVERVVESVFFRKRRAAEHYLVRAAHALPYATEESAVTDGLVQVPVDALVLAGAALYRESNDGSRFEGLATSTNATVAPAGFDRNHLLVRMLQSNEDPVWLEDLRTHLDAENAYLYVLAIPVTVRHELVSFVLYGAHANGAQLDPEETALLEELAREASRAYDHIEAVRTRERYAALNVLPGIA